MGLKAFGIEQNGAGAPNRWLISLLVGLPVAPRPRTCGHTGSAISTNPNGVASHISRQRHNHAMNSLAQIRAARYAPSTTGGTPAATGSQAAS